MVCSSLFWMAPRSATPAVAQQGNGQWYFYNPTAVNQGKQTFQRQWGKRENTDDWRRANQTVVNLAANQDVPEIQEGSDSISGGTQSAGDLSDSTMPSDSVASDTLANDPHNREYYLAQIPFTEEQVAASNNIIKDGLFHAGIIFKDKLGNLTLSERSLLRLTNNYTDFEQTDEAFYHLFLLYSLQGQTDKADDCLNRLKADYPESQWTILLADPNFVENARFGIHIEDSLYAATYDAFKDSRYQEAQANANLAIERFPLGQNQPKFLFISGLSKLNEGDGNGCMELLKQVVEKYPKSEVSEIAGMIVKGVQEGRPLHGGKFDLGDIWSRRDVAMVSNDSTGTDTLSAERNTNFLFLLVYEPDSVNENQLLFEMARYNFTNFLVRNFDLSIEQEYTFHRMLVSGFLNYDEVLQYARKLHATEAMASILSRCHSIIISQQNLALIGSHYSYGDYLQFYEKTFTPMEVSGEQLLNIPEAVEQSDDDDEVPVGEDNGGDDDEDTPQDGDLDFGEDFW